MNQEDAEVYVEKRYDELEHPGEEYSPDYDWSEHDFDNDPDWR